MTNRLFRATQPAAEPRFTQAASSLLLLILLASSGQLSLADEESSSQAGKKLPTERSPRRDFHPKIDGLQQSDEIPSNFPVPVYPGNVTSKHFVATTKGHPAAAATIITKDAADTAFAWYQTYCIKQKWAVKVPKGKARNKMEEEGRLYRLMATKGNERMIISCAKDTKGAATLINVSWTTKSK
jgi:hypothetical protein